MNEMISTLTPAQLAAAAVAVPLGYGFLCRLAGVTWSTVRARYVLLHLSGFAYCGTVLFLQPDGAEVLGEFIGLGFCACWLWVSYPTWRHGPPAHVLTGPAPFSDVAVETTYVLGRRGSESRWLQ